MLASTTSLLDHLFIPRSIAVVGAGTTTESMGSRLLASISGYGFKGQLYAVNRNGEPCGTIRGYRRVTEIPNVVDVCFIATAATAVPAIVEDCAAHGIPIAQILSSTYGQPSDFDALLLQAARGVTRLVGPNCLGTHSPRGQITFVPGADTRAGRVAIVSQSGGLTVDIIHQARVRGLHLSKAISIGDCLDLGPSDFLAYLGDDEETTVIGCYLEGIRDQRFVQVLREVGARKRVAILKGGRTTEGAASAASHTGALAGDYATWRAAIEQAGAVDVHDVDDLLATLTGFQHDAVLRGNRVALIGNGGGITVLTTDALAEGGMQPAALSEQTLNAIASLQLPAGSSLGAALDIPLNALTRIPEAILHSLFDAIIGDMSVDLLIVHFNLMAFALYENGEVLARHAAQVVASLECSGKPVYVALRGSPDPQIEGYRRAMLAIFQNAGLPCFADAVEAAHVAARVWRTSKALAQRDDVPTSLALRSLDAARTTLARAGRSEGEWLTQHDAFALLDAAGIPHTPIRFAKNSGEAVTAAETIGFPVALKIASPDILHKTEHDGVRLGLTSAREVNNAFDAIVAAAKNHGARVDGVWVQAMADAPLLEAILGVRRDPYFGAVIVMGYGGTYVELFRDVALRIAPISQREAREMWQSLRSRPLFEGFRGAQRADTPAFEEAVVRLSLLATTFPEIVEIDVNPLFLFGRGVSAVDCRVRISKP